MNFKLSRYNFTFPFNNTDIILYNSRTGALALIENQIYQRITRALPMIEVESYASMMLENGFLIASDKDELEMIKYNALSTKYATSDLFLTIAPTFDCNFRCIYCYEKERLENSNMSKVTQASLISFVENAIQNIKTLHVTWYGGEPLLSLEIIENLSKYFINICERNNVEYQASMITNGYLLTREVFNKISDLKVNQIQITLDGNADSHDKRRFLQGNEPTYESIMNNLNSIKQEVKTPIAIRINADYYNINGVDDVISELRQRGLLAITTPYLAMVDNADKTYNDNGCIGKNAFSKYHYDFIKRNELDIFDYVPQQITNYCGADSVNSFVIDPKGKIYKCGKDIGIVERSIGDLDGGIDNTNVLMPYMLYDATEDEMCKECKYLPICMGGCPYMRRCGNSLRCTEMKYNLDNYIESATKQLLTEIDFHQINDGIN